MYFGEESWDEEWSSSPSLSIDVGWLWFQEWKEMKAAFGTHLHIR